MKNQEETKIVTFKVKAKDKKILELRATEYGYSDLSEYIRDKLLDQSNENKPLNNAQIQYLVKVLLTLMWDAKFLLSEVTQIKHGVKSLDSVKKIVDDLIDHTKMRGRESVEAVSKMK